MHYSGQNDAILSRMEHRPFQQLILQNQYGRLQVQHRYRLEQRFIESVVSNEYTGSFEGNFRLRYQLNLQYRLSKKKEGQGVLLAVVADELMVNFGKKIVNNYFDQNRVRVGFSYQLFKNLSIGLDYQHIWQQRQRAASFFNTNCIRATFNYTLDLQKNVK